MSSLQKVSLNKRAITALTMFFSFLILLPSGIMMHFVADESTSLLRHAVMTIHNSCSFIFVVSAAIHIVFNSKLLLRYMQSKTSEYLILKKELAISLLAVIGLVLLLVLHVLHVHQ